jgi:transketolase
MPIDHMTDIARTAAERDAFVVTDADLRRLERRCTDVRLDVLELVEVAGSGHYGPAFSCVEVLVALYDGYLEIDPARPDWPQRDRFVLSKGHACSALYPLLADAGFFGRDVLATFTRLGSPLGDHPDMKKIPGVDFSSGSLGHGLSVAVGMAEAARRVAPGARTVALLGDGELNEGQVWEAAAYASARGLSSLLAIVDVNGVSVDGRTDEVLPMEPLDEKWSSFGWDVERVDGHDLKALRTSFARYDARRSRPGTPPTVLVADTIIGRGVDFIEGMAEWHVGYFHGIDRERAEASINAMYA